eukprot:TRINITY_DN2513_c0_g1_i2.p1 TRINITY_DN2513_c0_g1~~TRINITY_DN2513_c0_g1_i2.p1  ORF type:complete len:182 (+),score=15.32 TRINITY_DN2513_c0_g1_i2:113-658(+)
MPLNKVDVRSGGIHGHCWFAADDIQKGESIWTMGEWDKKPALNVAIETVKTWPKDQQDKFLALAYQIDDFTFSGFPPGVEIPQEILNENYVNHCCDGNMWYDPVGESDYQLIAIRDIKKGEELTYDYALTEADDTFLIPNCLCGKSACRKTITGRDYQNKDLQKKYAGHFLPYVQKRIDCS